MTGLRWISLAVVAQSLGVGLLGVLVALPVMFGLAHGAERMGTKMCLPWWLLTSTATVTVVMAVGSGLTALRSLRHMEPAALLR